MEADLSEAVNAFLGDDSGSDWENEICLEKEIPAAKDTSSKDNSSPRINDFDVTDDDIGIPPPSAKHMEVLKAYFGHSNFRPMQWKIINSIIEKKQDNCVIMATGYGKSLCYQYPAVYSLGTTIVISPLISLMHDQVLSLEVANISACFLGSAQSDKKVRNRVIDGEYRVVYMTPEFATGDYGNGLLNEMMRNGVNLTLIAVDEAHCVSQWGHDFRSSYRKLGKLRDGLPSVPFLAVTATATPEVKEDMIRSLHLRNPVVTCTGFDRPNLYLKVLSKSNSLIDDLRPFMFKTDGHWTFQGSTIIYCPTKKKTSSITDTLKGLGVECAEYHAGLRLDIRKDVHEKFLKDKIKVVVATVAFGMGIDKPNVRLIIHYGAPHDIELYYQEIGRAGRDGLPSSCLVFFNSSDFVLNRHFLSTYKTAQFKKHKEEMSVLLESYLETSECRRKLLLSHFKDSRRSKLEAGPLSKTCCDNCSRKASYGNMGIDINKATGLDDHGRFDFTEDAKLMLGAVKALGGHFGLTIPILFLRGSKSNRLHECHMKDNLYGKGKVKAEAYWKNLGRLLIRVGYLEECELKPFKRTFMKKSSPFATVNTSKKGEEFLKFWSREENNSDRSKERLLLVPPANMLDSIKTTVRKDQRTKMYAPVALPSFSADNIFSGSLFSDSADAASPVNEVEKDLQHKLYVELIELRNHLAILNNCMPYMVASDKSLVDMTKYRPSTSENLSQVDGFNEARIKKFGYALVDKVINFCKTNFLRLDNFPQFKPSTSEKTLLVDATMDESILVANLSDTVRSTYVSFQVTKKSIERISKERRLQLSTLINHLIEAIKKGLQVDLHRLGFTLDAYKIIETVIHSPPLRGDISQLTPIKNLCPPNITWDEIKVAIAVLHLKCKSGDQQEFEPRMKKLFGIQNNVSHTVPAGKTSSFFSKFEFSQQVKSSSSSACENERPAAYEKPKRPAQLEYDDDETDIEDEVAEIHSSAKLISSSAVSSSVENLNSEDASLQNPAFDPKSSGGSSRHQFDIEMEQFFMSEELHEAKAQDPLSSKMEPGPSPTFKRGHKRVFAKCLVQNEREGNSVEDMDVEVPSSHKKKLLFTSKSENPQIAFSETKQKLSQFSFLKNEKSALSTANNTLETEGHPLDVHESQELPKCTDGVPDEEERTPKGILSSSNVRLAESSEYSDVNPEDLKVVDTNAGNTHSSVCGKTAHGSKYQVTKKLSPRLRKLEAKKKRAKLANL